MLTISFYLKTLRLISLIFCRSDSYHKSADWYRSSFFDSRLEALQRHEQLLIEGLFDPVIGAIEVIDGRTPPVFLIGGEWKLIGLFGLSLFLDIEVPVPLSLLVVVILVLLQFIELMHCLQPVVIFTVDGHVIGDGLGLGKLL